MAINFDDAFTKNYMDSMYPQPPEEPAQDTMLAAGPVTSDAPQAFVGTRLNVPKAGQPQPTTQDRQRLGIQLFDALAAMPKGAVQATVGLPGDLESIGRTVLDYFGYNVDQETALPTSEDISKKLESTFGPVVPKGQTTIVPTAERERAAKSGETIGEFLPAPGIPEAVVRGGKLIRRGIQATKDMPVGMSTQIVGEGVSDLGFYSAAKQAVDSIQQPKGTGEQFLKQIEKTPGVKPEEIKWTGLDDFLKSKKSVTKAEVQEFLDKNRVEIKEVQLGEPTHEWQGNFLVINKTAVAKIDEAADGSYVLRDNINEKTIPLKSNRLDKAVAEAEDIYGVRGIVTPYEDKPKFSKYTLPGGENYREILITLPANKAKADNLNDAFKLWMEDAKAGKRGQYTAEELASITVDDVQDILKEEYLTPSTKGEFRSQHFDQPNILAHMRVNDRIDKDGKKVLFIEEVQSDWHQAGRKKGYQGGGLTATEQAEYDALQKEADALMQRKDLIIKNLPPEKMNRMRELSDKKAMETKGVPDAPFKTTWHELAMKRAIQLAAEGGYDRVAFTTGKTQAERYDLSKEISRITYTEAGVLRAYDKSDNMVLSKKLESSDQIEDYIGKEPAKKLLEKEVGKVNVDKKYTGPGMEFDGRELSGVDLKIGGEGMKGFYDQILPKFLDKYAKKWDAKTGMTKIQTESKGQAMADADLLEELGTPRDKIDTSGMVSVQYIDVTPKMKESVLTKGQPLFAIGAGGAAVQQEENQ